MPPPSSGRCFPAHHPADREGLPHGPGGGAGYRGGRLHHEALHVRGAACPDPRSAAAARGSRVWRDHVPRPSARHRRAYGDPRRPAHLPHDHGVRAPPASADKSRTGADQGPDHGTGLGLRLRRQREHCRGLRSQPAKEAGRTRRSPANPDHPRRRLRAEGGVDVSIRWRLAILYAASTGTLLLLVSLVAFALHNRDQYEGLDESLVTTAEHFLRNRASAEAGASPALERLESDVFVRVYGSGHGAGPSEAPDPALPPLEVLARDHGPASPALTRIFPGGGIEK